MQVRERERERERGPRERKEYPTERNDRQRKNSTARGRANENQEKKDRRKKTEMMVRFRTGPERAERDRGPRDTEEHTRQSERGGKKQAHEQLQKEPKKAMKEKREDR